MTVIDSSRLLLDSLQLAVPLEIMRMARWSPEERVAAGHAAVDTVTTHGDALQFKGPNAAQRALTREAFVALARGLAVLAYQPGGVTFCGQHWCVDHAECRAAEEAAAACHLPFGDAAADRPVIRLTPAGELL